MPPPFYFSGTPPPCIQGYGGEPGKTNLTQLAPALVFGGMDTMALPTGRKLISTAEAARILHVSMGRVRQFALLGPNQGGLHSWHAAPTALVFDEAEVRKFKDRDRGVGGRPGKFARN